MHRFFLPPETIDQDRVHFPAETARQLYTVLRLKPGSQIIVLDGNGNQHRVELSEVSSRNAVGQVLVSEAAPAEPRLRVTLYLSLTQRDKFEWMLQKCTEVGAAAFAPLITSRSRVQKDNDGNARQTRWQRILREAAEQSGRGRIPVLHPPRLFEHALQPGNPHELRLVAWENEHTLDLRTAIEQWRAENPSRRLPAEAAILIGAEGGLSPQEVETARRGGFQPLSLGRRILRMETAAVVATALLLHEMGID